MIFFFASAAASSAYLTVSEIFPLEIRALAIAFFFSIGTAVGGVAAPWLFGYLIGSGSRVKIFYGYLIAAILMLVAAVVEAFYGLKAERTSLEELAVPLRPCGIRRTIWGLLAPSRCGDQRTLKAKADPSPPSRRVRMTSWHALPRRDSVF